MGEEAHVDSGAKATHRAERMAATASGVINRADVPDYTPAFTRYPRTCVYACIAFRNIYGREDAEQTLGGGGEGGIRSRARIHPPAGIEYR